MTRLSLAVLAALEGGTLKGYQLVNRVRDLLALEGAPALPQIHQCGAAGLALQHNGLIACPHADRPVWGAPSVYMITTAGQTALEQARTNP